MMSPDRARNWQVFVLKGQSLLPEIFSSLSRPQIPHCTCTANSCTYRKIIESEARTLPNRHHIRPTPVPDYFRSLTLGGSATPPKYPGKFNCPPCCPLCVEMQTVEKGSLCRAGVRRSSRGPSLLVLKSSLGLSIRV